MQTETKELPLVTIPGKDYAELMEKVKKYQIFKSNLEQLILKFKSLGLDKIALMIEKVIDIKNYD